MISFFTSFDTIVLQYFASIRTIVGSYMFIWISEFGSVFVILGIALIVGLLLLIKRRFAEAAGLALAVGGSGIVVEVLKWVIARPRPDRAFAAYIEMGGSFPSSHAAESVALYGFLAFLFIRLSPRTLRNRIITDILILLPCIIAFGRLYLGVHYVSDVVVGMVIGGVFLAGGVMLTWKMSKT